MFNETEWLKLVFLLADTQTWVDDLTKEAIRRIPVPEKKKFLQRSYYLGITALAHIMERHYYKINRYPHAGKFHIPATEILHLIREAHILPASPATGTSSFERTVIAEKTIGYDKTGQPTNIITILTDAGGRIITAFPGKNDISCFHDIQTPVSTGV